MHVSRKNFYVLQINFDLPHFKDTALSETSLEFSDTFSSYDRKIILQNYQERVTCSEIKNSFSEMNFYSDDELVIIFMFPSRVCFVLGFYSLLLCLSFHSPGVTLSFPLNKLNLLVVLFLWLIVTCYFAWCRKVKINDLPHHYFTSAVKLLIKDYPISCI